MQTFHQGLLDLGGEIKQLLSLLAAIQDQAKINYLQYTIVAIMKVICEAARFTQGYLDREMLGIYLATRMVRQVLIMSNFRKGVGGAISAETG